MVIHRNFSLLSATLGSIGAAFTTLLENSISPINESCSLLGFVQLLYIAPKLDRTQCATVLKCEKYDRELNLTKKWLCFKTGVILLTGSKPRPAALSEELS